MSVILRQDNQVLIPLVSKSAGASVISAAIQVNLSSAIVPVINIKSVSGSPTSYSLKVKLQGSVNNEDWVDITGGSFPAQTALGITSLSINIQGFQYIRSVYTLTFVGGTNPAMVFDLNIGLYQFGSASESHIGETGGRTVVSSVEITRATPDATAYAANDAVTPAAGGLSEITNVARIAGGSGYITQIRVSTNKKSITPRLRLHFFNASNPTISADNLPWQDKYADAAKRVTYVDLPAMVTAADTTNSDMSRTMDATVRVPFKCADATTSIFIAIETLDAFTPDAGQKFTIKLNTELN